MLLCHNTEEIIKYFRLTVFIILVHEKNCVKLTISGKFNKLCFLNMETCEIGNQKR